MRGTNAAKLPRSSTPGTFNPGGREAPSGGAPGTRKCPALHHIPPLVSTTAKYWLEFWQEHLVTHSLPLRRREGRFKFIQGFSTAPFLLKSPERWVPRPFLQPEDFCSDETERESFMVCKALSRTPAHLEPPAPCERSTINSHILQVR